MRAGVAKTTTSLAVGVALLALASLDAQAQEYYFNEDFDCWETFWAQIDAGGPEVVEDCWCGEPSYVCNGIFFVAADSSGLFVEMRSMFMAGLPFKVDRRYELTFDYMGQIEPGAPPDYAFGFETYQSASGGRLWTDVLELDGVWRTFSDSVEGLELAGGFPTYDVDSVFFFSTNGPGVLVYVDNLTIRSLESVSVEGATWGALKANY
jgi:hypothetical protein